MSTLAPTLLTDALAEFQRAEQDLVHHASSRMDPRTGRLAPRSCPYGCCVDPVQANRAVAVSAWLARPEHCVLHPGCAVASELLSVLVQKKQAYDDARRVCGVYVSSILGPLMPRISVTLDVADLPTEQSDRLHAESRGGP